MYFAPCGGIFMTIYLQQEIHTKQKLRSVSFVNALMIYIYITRLFVYIIARAKIWSANEENQCVNAHAWYTVIHSQLKSALVAIACAVESMKLPLKNRVTIEEEKQNLTRRLFIHDYQLADPVTMKVENDFRSSPPFGLFDIFNHLIYHSSEYDKQGFMEGDCGQN